MPKAPRGSVSHGSAKNSMGPKPGGKKAPPFPPKAKGC